MSKWICLSPFGFGWGDNQCREIGALSNGLRQGEQSVEFLVLDDRSELSTEEVQCAKFSDLVRPNWWQGKGSLITLFGTKNMFPVYSAAKQAGCPIWVRLDCDGVPGPSGGLKKYFSSKITEHVDLQRRRRSCSQRGTLLGIIMGIARACAGATFVKSVNNRLIASFNMIDVIMVESELAAKSFSEYFHRLGRPDLAKRLHIIPPAISETFQLRSDVTKSKSIVATGQWWRFQKNMEFLCKVIASSREKDSQIAWHVIGGGSELVENRLRSSGVSLGMGQVECHNHLPTGKLNNINQTAQIIFFASRQEGFPNTLCEALCCGVSFVGPSGIQAFDYCESQAWGTTYSPRSLESAIHALEKELTLWRTDKRSAFEVSKKSQATFHRKFVAEQICELRLKLHF